MKGTVSKEQIQQDVRTELEYCGEASKGACAPQHREKEPTDQQHGGWMKKVSSADN
jgi:hypothetical protein